MAVDVVVCWAGGVVCFWIIVTFRIWVFLFLFPTMIWRVSSKIIRVQTATFAEGFIHAAYSTLRSKDGWAEVHGKQNSKSLHVTGQCCFIQTNTFILSCIHYWKLSHMLMGIGRSKTVESVHILYLKNVNSFF